jgi:hypothetical protein
MIFGPEARVARLEGVMAYSLNRLPTRFPVGTKFVVEGRPARDGKAQIFSRFIEFPDGTTLRLPQRSAPLKSAPAGRRGRIKGKRGH